MTVQEIFMYSGGALFVILSLIEIAPIKINPWSGLAKWLGRAIYSDLKEEFDEVKGTQKETRDLLEKHIKADERCKADECRARILHFNNELLRDIPHTKEEFIEILKDIDDYKAFCRNHPDYANGRAVHAINNIDKTYDERLEKHDFL